MKMLCVGLNWKTPVLLRERLAFEGDKLFRALGQLKQSYSSGEFAILSTCNRTEVYVASQADQSIVDANGICEFIATFHDLPLGDFYDHLYFHEDTAAALHLFKVASGLDSLVLGEAQILGQVKHAYQSSVDQKAAGPILHALFQRSLGVAKRVQSTTGLSHGRLSIASAAVEYLQGVFERFDDKIVLIIGAGKMAELTLTHLRELEPKDVIVTNRNRTRAEDLVARFGGTTRPFEDLFETLAMADIVISSTAAEQPIVRLDEFRGVMAARRQRLTAIIDIAVPLDFDPAIADLDNVLLWNIDDLEKVRDRTLRSREGEFEKAIAIVDSEASAFQASLAAQRSGPVIGKLEEYSQRIVESELEWLLPQLNGVSDVHRDKIRHFAHRLKNKLLHPPKATLRVKARQGEHHGLLDALRNLFRLDDD